MPASPTSSAERLRHTASAFGRLFARARIPLTAAGLTFMTQLALVPVLTLVLLLSHTSPHIDLLTDAFVDYPGDVLFPEGTDALLVAINRFRHHAAAMPVFGLFALSGISLLFVRTVSRTFGSIWHTAAAGKAFWKQWAAYGGVLLLLPLAMGAARLLGTLLPAGAAFVLTLAAAVWLLYCFYRFVPAAAVSRRAAMAGAVSAAFALKAAHSAFVWYNATLGLAYAQIYGGFAAVLMLLLWINLMWTILLSGAVLAAVVDIGSHAAETQEAV